ncbi:MAG TPA: TetR/AcrR family transcriptional regulator, partial [Dietzia sp.]|nr:TetR/AcrR family transcriptional regulator [Dietzia sp.]
MTSTRSIKPGPRERLLATATRLFSTDGIRAVGIDRILREAGVAKAS